MQVRNKLWLGLCLLMVTLGWGQEQDTFYLSQEQLTQIQKSEEALSVWFEEIKTPGVKIEGNQMIFSEEAQKLIKDVSYRENVYKENYSFADVQQSLARFEMQKAFWQMLNLYPDHKEDVVRYIYAYDKAFPTDEVVVASFYTYAFFDPAITDLSEGKPNVHRPDIFEDYLRRTQEIVTYIEYFRNEEAKTKS
ncbi:hypothetical protein POV27_01265 [Aureisphaera galaxeae]|uniref:hypothetical protein n=1 Tax=Aureisphaera galaxeae TaxID=1538023 RepID=UPI002350A0E2|nr:hypothetical protein [Aureisphaera galaxeae]MDC8002667.1 hypothetical protein [Aureisphaera galaxeae]